MLRRPLGATRTSKLFPNTTLFRSGYVGQAFLGLGNAYILTSVVVAVIGGVVLGGGRGDYVNVAIAAIFVTVLTSLLTAVQIGEASRQIIFGRSEEHTSELQSLMRISYALFCLKKTKEK